MKKILTYLRERDLKIGQEKHGDTRSGRNPMTNFTSPESWQK
jgi:hypothetical protein